MNEIFSLRLSTPSVEGILQVSKWLKIQALLDDEEMRSLLSSLSPCFIFNVSAPVVLEEALIEQEHFLQGYVSYVSALKRGEIPDEGPLKRCFSSALSTTQEALYAMPIGKERYLIKPIKPVVQLQGHHFFYSSVDGKFHPMVLSQESVTWGIQFSYPQIFQHPKSHAYAKIDSSPAFPNTQLFRALMQWMRNHTMATPFLVHGKRINVPIRLGKRCIPWIAKHPQLVAKQIQVLA